MVVYGQFLGEDFDVFNQQEVQRGGDGGQGLVLYRTENSSSRISTRTPCKCVTDNTVITVVCCLSASDMNEVQPV